MIRNIIKKVIINMKTLKDIEYLQGVRVLVRADFNVPINNGVVVEDFRIKAALPTIDYMVRKGAKVILMSHLESSDGTNPSLAPVADRLKKLGQEVIFVKDYNKALDIINEKQQNGGCVLLENLRFFDGEKKNDPKFAKELASLGDIYVNDAFSVSHRRHASVVGVPKLLPSYAGLQLEKEIVALSRAFEPAHPFLFILGGAKFDTKLPLLSKFLNIADGIFVGGALVNDLLKAKGLEIGKSSISDGTVDVSMFLASPKIILPADILNEQKKPIDVDQISRNDRNMDMGPKSLELLRAAVKSAKFILWNGPMGVYEDGYKDATIELAKIVSDATVRGAETIVGGGDTLAAIAELGASEKISFISTGGGAMLDFLAKGTLPGIDALGLARLS
ncbi:MAG: phosphoglycerate kinase [Candidatus Taylorbacteria bacterium]